MTRQELVALRERIHEAVEHRRELGDYDTNAAPIRMLFEIQLAIVDHLLLMEKHRK